MIYDDLMLGLALKTYLILTRFILLCFQFEVSESMGSRMDSFRSV